MSASMYWRPSPADYARAYKVFLDSAEPGKPEFYQVRAAVDAAWQMAVAEVDDAARTDSAMSDDLITWLRAQLDEDEQDARRRDFHTDMCSRFLDPGGDCSCDYSDFVLADVEAKRRILDDHAVDEGQCLRCAGSRSDGEYWLAAPCPTVRLLALPYADHPGYRDEWRP